MLSSAHGDLNLGAGANNSSKQTSPFRKRHLPSRQDSSNPRSVSTGWESERGRAAVTATQPRDDAKTPCSWWGPGSPLLRPIVKEGVLKKRGGRINAWGDRCVLPVHFCVCVSQVGCYRCIATGFSLRQSRRQCLLKKGCVEVSGGNYGFHRCPRIVFLLASALRASWVLRS